MTAAGSTISLPAPEERYTMPPERVHHLITDDQLNIIKNCGQSSLFDLSLLLAGVSAGFFQNFWITIVAVAQSKTIEAWDAIATLVCVASIVASLVTYFCFRNRKTPFKNLISEIEGREKKAAKDLGVATQDPVRQRFAEWQRRPRLDV